MEMITNINKTLNNPVSLFEKLSQEDIKAIKNSFGWLSEEEVDERAEKKANARIDARI